MVELQEYGILGCGAAIMSTSRRNVVIGISVIVLGLVTSTPGWAKVKAWEGTINIPTYGWEDDINPKFWALEDQIKLSTTVKGAIVYPYTMQDHLSRVKKDHKYKALFLENEYLKVTCLPELGGRLHSVFDKTEGKETFHLNRVIKPSMIAMRGAFISGGVEWNAGPQVHTVTIVSPVDALVGTNPDGSAYLEVSNLEKTLRTRWTVRVTLYPGKAYLDEQIRIVNPVDAVNPYYFWNCTAFPCREGTRFIYPMTLGTDHNGTKFFSWPVNEGRDLSWLKNYPSPSSIFSVDCTYDFFGAYDVDANRGVVQVANHYELSGKKAWTWGTSPFGAVCQQNLTDEDGAYIEVQSGPLPTQSDYGMLVPRQAVAWREWWYPIHGLGDGFEFATKDLAVQSVRENGQVQLRMLSTAKFSDASCSISRKGADAVTKRVDLSPMSPQVVAVPAEPNTPVDVTVRTSGGNVLAAFTTPLPIPKVEPPHRRGLMDKPDAELTVEQEFLKAQKFDLSTNRKKARQYYEMALAADPNYSPALRALAVLDLEAAFYDSAAGRLQKAVDRDPGDGLAWYFLGVAHLKTHNAKEALRCARQAVRCTGTGSLALDLAGRVHAALGERQMALDVFEKAARLNPGDAVARDHWLLALYAAGDSRSAFENARKAVAQQPTDLVPRAFLALQNAKELDRFVREARAFVGEDDFEMLEASLVFADAGLAREAATLLSAMCVDAAPQAERSPLPLYYLAWLASLQNDQEAAQKWLKQAAETYKDGVFPSRPEELEILAYAIRENPGDAQAYLYIGNLYAHLGRPAESEQYWTKAVELNPSLSVAYRNLGLYAWAAENDLAMAERFYRKAIEVRPKDQTLYRDLADILLGQARRLDAIRVLEAAPYTKLPRADILIMLAQAYLDEQRYSRVIELLESTPYFVNWEGQTITWDLFHKAHMKRGQGRFESKDLSGALRDFEAALTYPENIGVGRPNSPREAAAQYWKGRTLQLLGRQEDARQAWKEGVAGAEGNQEQNESRQLCITALQGTE
jgi:tetratricopeptide (TPR) repeat protein